MKKPNIIIKNDRIELHSFNDKFITSEYLSWLQNPKINKYLVSSNTSYTMDNIREYAQGLIDSSKDLFFAIVWDGRHVGNIRLGPITSSYTSMGIMVGGSQYHGQGIAGEAVGLLTDFAFNVMMISWISLCVVKENVSAVKLFKRNGFIDQKKPGHITLNGQDYELIHMRRYAKPCGLSPNDMGLLYRRKCYNEYQEEKK